MKKMIAGLIALTAAFCSMTACSKSMENENSSTGKENTTAQVTTEAATDEETTAAEEETTSAKASDTKEYEAALKEFIDAYNQRDYRKTLQMSYPDGMEDIIRVSLRSEISQREYGDVSEDEMIKDLQYTLYSGDREGELILVDIKGTDPLLPSEEYDLRCDCGMVKWCSDFIKANGGVDSVDADAMEKAAAELDEEELAAAVELEEAFLVTFELKYAPTGETNEGYAIMFRTKDSGWKLSPEDLLGTELRGSIKHLEIDAHSIYNSGMSSLVDMHERGDLTASRDAFIIASDDTKNYNVPDDFDTEGFMELLSSYYSYTENDKEWFMEIKDGYVITVVVYDHRKPRLAGAYPAADSEGAEFDGMGYEDIYKKCCEDTGR